MQQRMNYVKAAPEGFAAMMGVEKYVVGSGLEKRLIELVKLRASQINGCAFCVDMHWKDARAAGETEERLYMLSAWHEATVYSERERAALAWTEAVTNIAATHAPDDVYEATRKQFPGDKEFADLTWLIAAINAWNRVAISMRSTPGMYKAREVKSEK